MPVGAVTTTVVVSTVHPGPGGGAIFTGHDADGNWIKVIGDGIALPQAPVKGSTWLLTGLFRKHPIYGEQLHLASCEMVKPSGNILVSYLKTHPSFRRFGLGAKKIDNLFRTFGSDLGPILDRGDITSLTQVLPREVSERLVEAWRASAQESSIVGFLNKYGIDVRLARKLMKYWGEKAVEKLQENPYRILILTSWEATDGLARKLGVSPEDPRRLVAATEAWLYRRLDQHKDTLTDADGLKQGVRMLMKCSKENLANDAIDAALREKAIVGGPSSGYQPVGCAVMEQFIASRLKSLLSGEPAKVSTSEIDRRIEVFERQEGIKLNVEQRAAIHMAATQPLSVLTGGAGVGKTTVLKAVCQNAEAAGVSVHQLALAGRAAQRLREATDREAYTIVGFLNRLQHGKLLPKSGDLVVVDESSMLDLILTYSLIRALPRGIRLLFVGDPYQLPPIGPGLVFHVLARSRAVPVIELFQVHRQAASSGIPQVAGQVRSGELPKFNRYEGVGRGASFIESNDEGIMGHLWNVINDFGGFNETQILGVTKSGCAGVKLINETFHREKAADQLNLKEWGVAETEPIIYTVNDYERELFNGSLGRVEKIFPYESASGACEETPPRLAIADFEGRKIDLSDDDLGKVELAYAVTTHKAQGSQFRRVIVPVVKSRILDRTLLYTALTRGIEQVVFIGHRRVFNEAVINPPSATLRRVGLAV